MSLFNAACCCATTTGRCCILVTPGPGDADCADLCEDNKTPAQCAALGGVWEAGACADIEPDACKGVCCATTTAGYFVACQEGVTQCECFSDNLAVGVNTTWTSGANLTCADIACPCQCSSSPCPCIQYLIVKKTTTITTQICDNTCSFKTVQIEYTNQYFGSYCQSNGLFDGCPDQGVYLNDKIDYLNNVAGYTQVDVHCDDGRTITQVVAYEASLGSIVCPNSLCSPTTINLGTDYISGTCEIIGTCDTNQQQPVCNPNLTYYTPSQAIVNLPYCDTCGYENCVHVYDDCVRC